MATNEFDLRFQQLTKELVEITFEFAGYNDQEIEEIYILGSIEEDEAMETNFFYRIKGKVVAKQSINDFLDKKTDLSRERQVQALKLQNEILEKLALAFKQDEREVPSVLKLTYEPPTNKFNCELAYGKIIGKNEIASFYDLFTTWKDEMSK